MACECWPSPAGFMVIRDGELVFMSPQQQHEFNFPYQIGSPDSMSDTPQVRPASGGAGARAVSDVVAGWRACA